MSSRYIAATGICLLLAACRTGTPDTTPTPETNPAVASTPATPTQISASAATATALIEAELPAFEASLGRQGISDGELTLPFGIAATDDGHLWVADSTGVQKLRTDGSFVLRIEPAVLPQARGLAVGNGGTLYVAGHGSILHVFEPDGTLVGTLGDAGDAPGQLRAPVDVLVLANGNLAVADPGNGRVEILTPGGQSVRSIGGPGDTAAQFRSPRSVAEDSEGRLYVGSGDDYLIQRFAATGSRLDAFGTSSQSDVAWQMAGLTFGPDGTLYALQVMKHEVQAYDVEADPPRLKWKFGELGQGFRQLSNPSAIAYADGRIFVADTANHRIQVFRLKP